MRSYKRAIECTCTTDVAHKTEDVSRSACGRYSTYLSELRWFRLYTCNWIHFVTVRFIMYTTDKCDDVFFFRFILPLLMAYFFLYFLSFLQIDFSFCLIINLFWYVWIKNYVKLHRWLWNLKNRTFIRYVWLGISLRLYTYCELALNCIWFCNCTRNNVIQSFSCMPTASM